MQFRDAERFCRMGLVTRTSNFQTLALGYQSSSGAIQQRARLSCQAVALRVPCDCGWSQPTRITNGVEAAKHEFPSMVGLRDVDSNIPILCGGSIISDRFIVTAAHCTDRQTIPSRWVALIGFHDLRLGKCVACFHFARYSLLISQTGNRCSALNMPYNGSSDIPSTTARWLLTILPCYRQLDLLFGPAVWLLFACPFHNHSCKCNVF